MRWIPLRQEPKGLLCFNPPPDVCGSPDEVFFPRVGQLLASQAPITVLRPEPNSQIRKLMGFPISAPLDLVVLHFRKVLSLCINESAILKEPAVIKALGQIYRFFGGEGPGEADEFDGIAEDQELYDAYDLADLFSKVPCILDQQNNCLWRPEHVFFDDVRYMEPWRRTIRNSEDAIERGYSALGRRPEPNIEDWKQVLEEIAESGESHFQSEVSSVIREVIRRIVEELMSTETIDGDVLVPARNGRILPAEDVFIADAPWYEQMLDSWDLPILASSVSGIVGIQHVLKIPSMAASVEQRLTEYPEDSDQEGYRLECDRLQTLLQSQEFILGLERLLRHEGQDVSVDDLSFLSTVRVRCVKTIHTCLYLQSDGTQRLLGDDEADSYWDRETQEAMLSEDRRRYFNNDLAGELNRALADNTLSDLAPLVHVFGCEPSEISDVLDDLKIRSFTDDSDVGAEDEGDVVPQEFPDEEGEWAGEEDSAESEMDDEPMQEDSDSEVEGTLGTDDLDTAVKDEQSLDESTASRPERTGSGQAVEPSGGGPHGGGQGERVAGDKQTGGRGGATGRTDIEISKPTGKTTDGSTASRDRTRKQRRLVSYVSSGEGDDQEAGGASSGSDNHSIRIGDAAVEIVIEHERNKGWSASSMVHSNPGYDVISERDGDKRYIEVKGIEAAWGERGVALTSTQFYFSREYPERDYWLYVVEDVFSKSPRVHEIHEPSEQVDRFVFDGGWSQVAESYNAVGIEMASPSRGDEVLLDGRVIGIVESISEAGRFTLVHYRNLDGTQCRKRLSDIEFRSREQ